MALGWLWWRAWVSVDAVAFCVAGVALGDMDLHFAWQAWHFVTWIVTLHGRRGTYGIGLAHGGALGSQLTPWTPRLLAWQAWHLVTCIVTCVAGVALCDMDRHFAWQAWPLGHWAGSGGALGRR